MNQTYTIGHLSRAALKDRAKGALIGKYGKFIMAFLLINLITLVVQNMASSLVSFLLSPILLSSEMAGYNLSTEQVMLLLESDAFNELFMKWYVPINYVVLTISLIFTSVFKVGLTLFALNIACSQPTQLSDIFYGFRNQFGKALKISVMFVLMGQLTQLPATIISNMDFHADFSRERIITLLLILLVCSILYVLLYLGFSQVYFLFLDFPGYSAGQLIKHSFRIMKGHKKRLLLLELSFLPLILLSLLTFGIGDLWLTPYMQLTYTFFFLNLMQVRTPAQTNTSVET